MSQRIPHIIKHNKGTEIPVYNVFYDTETKSIRRKNGDREEHLRLGWCCWQFYDIKRKEKYDEWYEFYRPYEIWKFIDSKLPEKKKVYVWAHNADFDFRVTHGFTELERLGYKLKKFVFETGRIILNWHKSNKTIMIVDSMNFFKSSLAALGNSIGIPKMEVDFGMVSDEDLSVYCHNDVQILKEAITRLYEFIYEHDLGSFKPTVASQAFTAYKHRFMKIPIFVHTNSRAERLEIKSYKGGRSEAFFIGDVKDLNLHCLDVNSMYPFIMLSRELPTKLVKVFSDISVKNMKKIMDKYLVIADMEFYINQPFIGCKRDRLIFPVGKIREVVTSPEIKLILENGFINKINQVNVYEKGEIFKDYVGILYDLRKKYKKEGNQSYQLFCKYMLNSLYGKFGQRIRPFEKEELKNNEDRNKIIDYYDVETKEKKRVYCFGGFTWIKGEKKTSFDSFIAIPSFITAYARCYLWELIDKAKLKEVFYVDTDSLFTTDRGFERVKDYIDKKKLGMLDEEDKKITEIRGVKNYNTTEERKIKGISKRAIEISDRVFEQEQFQKLITGTLHHDAENVIVMKVKKELTGKYLKGIVTKTGRVKPFILDEW